MIIQNNLICPYCLKEYLETGEKINKYCFYCGEKLILKNKTYTNEIEDNFEFSNILEYPFDAQSIINSVSEELKGGKK